MPIKTEKCKIAKNGKKYIISEETVAFFWDASSILSPVQDAPCRKNGLVFVKKLKIFKSRAQQMGKSSN